MPPAFRYSGYDHLLPDDGLVDKSLRQTRPEERGLPRDETLRRAQRYVRDLTVADLGESWPEVINRAARDVKTDDEPRDLRTGPDDYRPYARPYYWGAFICQGNPSPLPATGRNNV